MKKKKWVNKLIALLLAAIMVVPSSLGTVAYAQEPEVSSEQTQTIQNADEDISEANEQETADASQKEQEKKETQETQDTESKETQKEDSYEVKLSKADNGLLSFPISEDDLVKADVENSTQSILDASEEDVEYESKDSYEENTEVKVQTSADYGYELDKVELEDKSGEVLQELSVDEEGIATFTMPEENVKVAATFKEIPESVIEDAEIDLQTTASDYEIATRAAGTKSIYLNVPGNKIWYGRYNTRYYTTNEGQVAYCMNPLLKTPGAGWYTGSLISDGSSRKAFYYAYGGPGYSQFVNRYGWIWNGVRDLEYAYSHVILSYTYAKYALHNNSQANYAFYGLPNSTKKHLINKANQMQAMGGIPSGYAVYYFNTSYNHQPMAFQVNNVATLSLRKSSSNTDITNGNSCYSLANAKYGVYSNAACTSQVSTFTTNANGTSNSINLEPGTYYVKEISAPEGYYIDNTVKTVSLSSGENKVVSFTDKPIDDPAAIVIQKKDKYTGNTIKGKKTLAGAQFTIKYYDGFYDRNNLPARATRTWVIETKERTRPNGSKVYQAGLSDTYKVGGDNFYKVDGAITIPRGTITIQETKAPDGYRNDLNMTDTKGNSTVNGVYLAQVTKPGDLSTLMGGQTFEGSDSPVRADIKLKKINGTNNNTMENIPFKITNLNTKESHTIYTDYLGEYDSSKIKNSLNTNTDKANAGVWFGDTSILSDNLGAFEYGDYSIEELSCKENDGKILYKGTFKIDANTKDVLDLGEIINNNIEVKTYATDNTSGNNNTAFIQQGGIFDYTTGQLTYGKAIADEVDVKGISTGYAVANLVDKDSGEYILNKDGSLVQAEAKIEPYDDGTYTGQAHQFLVYDNPESMFGKNIVVYERIYELNADGTPNYNKLLVEHTDLNDDLQTVKFQKINTELTVADTGLHEVNTSSKSVTLQDRITYENFSNDLVDLGYYVKMNAKLVDENGNAITDTNGKEITSGFSAKKFTSDMLKNGDTIHYTLPASVVKKYAGKKLISQVEIYFAFDTDTTNGDPWNLWTYEKDTANEKQTVTIPAITGTCVSADLVGYKDKGITDEVNLTGLTRGNTYTLVGKIVDKSTGKVVSTSRKCKYGQDAYDISKVVPADEGNYTVNKSDTLNVYYLKKDVFSSGTTVKSGYYCLNDDGTKYVLCTESGQILDSSNEIEKDLFENEILYPGEEFKEVTELIAKKEFVASSGDTTQYVDFEFDPADLAGKSYVITEDLYFSKLRDPGTEIDEESDGKIYAVLYTDGTLTFQKTKKVYASKTVKERYVFSSDEIFNYTDAKAPWYNNKSDIQTVEFRDVIKPISTAYWFYSCDNLTTFRKKNLDTSKTIYMQGMFNYCKGLKNLDLNDWDTSNVKNMSDLFSGCSNLENLAISNWNTSNVTDMSYLFGGGLSGTNKLQTIDISNWDVSNVKDMSFMFAFCEKITNLNTIRNWDVSNVKDMSSMFAYCKNITTLDLSKWNISNVTNINKIFEYCQSLTSLNLNSWNTSQITNMKEAFLNCDKLNSLGIDKWDTSNVNTMAYMFEYCTALSQLNISNWRTGNLTTTEGMFLGSGIKSIDLNSWDVSKVTTIKSMFNGCDNLSSLNLNNWDTSNIKDMSNVFYNCDNLSSLKVSNWDTSNVTDMSSMFAALFPDDGGILSGTNNLTSIYLTNWDTSNVTNMSSMFSNSNNLVTLYVSDKWNVTNVTSSDDMFQGCENIKGQNGTKYNSSKTDKSMANFATGYLTKVSGSAGMKLDKKDQPISVKNEDTNESSKSSPKAVDGLTVDEILNTIETSDSYNAKDNNSQITVQDMNANTTPLYSHNDLQDEDETFYVPEIATTFTNSTGEHLFKKEKDCVVIDTVAYKGLKPGKSYSLTGKLVDDSGWTISDSNWKNVTATQTFTPSSSSGTVQVKFTFDSSNVSSNVMIAYETLNGNSLEYGWSEQNKELAIHQDLNDENQTVHCMAISTKAKDGASNTKQITHSKSATVIDTIAYKGATVGATYSIKGKIVDKSTGDYAKDGDGNIITVSDKFTADKENGTKDVTFTFNSEGMAGGEYVVCESISQKKLIFGIEMDSLVTSHEDLNDEDQTVTLEDISTNIYDAKNNTNYTYAVGPIEVHDTVSYEGLLPGKSYTLTGSLVEKKTSKVFTDATGKKAEATKTFTPTEASGEIDMVYNIDVSNLKSTALVAYETLSSSGKEIVSEKDLNNEQQTLHFPIISTSATDKKTNTKEIEAEKDMTIVDTITYQGIQYGMDHFIKSYLMDKDTGKILKDSNGNDIVKTTEWNPEATDGTIDVEISFDGSHLSGKTVVVYEEIYLGDNALVACHKDINDSAQTLKITGSKLIYKDCAVIKRIKADDYWKEHGDPTFIFKLTGTDTLGAAHTYYQSVTFTENYVKAHTDSDGYVEMKAVFGQVPAGEYTCSEESVSRFEFESLTKPVNATINGKTAVYHLTDNNDTACATFTNKKYEEGDFGHDSVVVNHFNHKTQD